VFSLPLRHAAVPLPCPLACPAVLTPALLPLSGAGTSTPLLPLPQVERRAPQVSSVMTGKKHSWLWELGVSAGVRELNQDRTVTFFCRNLAENSCAFLIALKCTLCLCSILCEPSRTGDPCQDLGLSFYGKVFQKTSFGCPVCGFPPSWFFLTPFPWKESEAGFV